MGNASIWDGNEWISQEIESPFDKTQVYLQDTTPSSTKQGNLWVNSTQVLKYYDALWKDLKIDQTNVIGLSAALAGKANTSHVHDAADTNAGTFDTARIPNLDAAKITTGTFADARIPSLNASKTNAGTFDIARIPTGTTGTTVSLGNHTHTKADITDFAHTHPASEIVSGTLDLARIPSLPASQITSGTLDIAHIPNLDAAKTTTGIFDLARIPTGTSGSTVAMGNHVHNAADTTTGIFDAARIPEIQTLKHTVIGSGADLNAYTTAGHYSQASNAAAESGSNYPQPMAGFLEVTTNSTTVWQRYTTYRHTALVGTELTGTTIYVRAFYTGTWSPWRSVGFDSGSITGGYTAEADWTINSFSLRKVDRTAFIYFTVTLAGSAITVPATTGNITNSSILTLADTSLTPALGATLASGATGRTASAYIHTSRVISLVAVAPGSNIATGEQFSFGGSWLCAT